MLISKLIYNWYKYYIIISIMLFTASIFGSFPIFAESQNSSLMVNLADIDTLVNKANNFSKQQKYDEAIEDYDKAPGYRS